MGHQVFSWLIQIKAHNSVGPQGFLFHHLASSRGWPRQPYPGVPQSLCVAALFGQKVFRPDRWPRRCLLTDAAPLSCIRWCSQIILNSTKVPKLPLLKVLIEISKIPAPLQSKQSHYTTPTTNFTFNLWASLQFLGFPDWFRPFRLGDFLPPKNSNPSLWPSREIFREPCWTRTHGRRTTRIHPEFWDSLGGRWQNDLWIQLCQIKP